LLPGELPRRARQPLQRVLLVAARLGERLGIAARLRLGQRFACVQQPPEVDLPLARETVHEPDRDGRLPQLLDLVRELALAFGAESLRDLVPRRGELVQRQRVEPVELVLEAHAPSLDQLRRAIVSANATNARATPPRTTNPLYRDLHTTPSSFPLNNTDPRAVAGRSHPSAGGSEHCELVGDLEAARTEAV
jgi:hypothetical protein